MSKTEVSTAKTSYDTAAKAKARATVLTKTTGQPYGVVTLEDGTFAARLLKVKAVTASPAPAAPKASGVKRTGGAVTQAVKYLHKQGQFDADALAVKEATSRKGSVKFWIVAGDTRLSWFPSADKAQAVLAAV